MKILILSDDFPPFALGGAGSVAFNTARELVKRGHTVSVVTSVRSETDAGVRYIDGIKIYSFQDTYHERWRAYISIYNPKAISFVGRIIDQERPDVVHAHNVHKYISYYSLVASKKRKVRVVLTVHDCMIFHYGKFTDFINPKDMSVKDSYDYRVSGISQLRTFKWRYNPFRNILIKHCLKYVDSICAVSYELKKALVANGITNVSVVHNALDNSIWRSDSVEVNKFIETNNLNNFRRVLFSGKLTRAKGGEQLVGALVGIENVALIIVGQKDRYTEDLVYKATSLGIKVVITGWLNESQLPNVYSTADIVVFPSICFDTFGMVNLEAMALKKPVIATCFGGAREIVVDGKSGYIVNPYNTNDLRNKINMLLSNKVLNGKMGEKGSQRIIDHFNISKQINEYMTKYLN
jgi:glycosyltransferase involved in cell wall biosynthesis